MKIEELINGWIGDAVLLQTKVMPLTEAKKAGAIAMFGEKYGEEVSFIPFPSRVSLDHFYLVNIIINQKTVSLTIIYFNLSLVHL